MKNIIIGSILLFIIIALASIVITKGIKNEVSEYEKPDTLIVIKNGKADTTITIKQVPSIFK